jgi:putative phage-type endonuclease
MAVNNVSQLPEILGTAHLVGNFANQSPEWHEQRAKGIGGSDAGVLAGLSPWQSPYTWAAKRLGLIEDNLEPNEAMFWGTTLESVILDVWAKDHPEFILHREVGTWCHQERTWQQANPDAIFQFSKEDPALGEDQDTRGFGIIEVKTARYEDGWNEKTGDIPAHYRAQVLWYLQTFGFQRAYVVVLFAGSKLRTFQVDYNEFEADANLAAVVDVKAFVDAGSAPDFSAPYTSTLQTVREQHPEIDPDGKAELGELFVEYAEVIAAETQAVEQANLAKSKVLAAMGDAKNGLFNGEVVVTRQARNGGTPYLVNKRR